MIVRILHATDAVQLAEVDLNTEYAYTVYESGARMAERYDTYNEALDRYTELTRTGRND